MRRYLMSCLAAEILISVIYPDYLIIWPAAGSLVALIYMNAQYSAQNRRFGRVIQENYRRATPVSNKRMMITGCIWSMAAPPLIFAGMIRVHYRAYVELSRQRARGEAVVTGHGDADAWGKATRE